MHEPAADADRQRRGEHAAELDQAEVPRRHPDAVQVRVVQRPVRRVEAAALLGLAGVGLDHAHAGDALLQRRQVLADPFADVEVGRVRVALELDRGDDDDRQHRSATSVSCHESTNSTTSENDEQDRRRHELQQTPLHELAHRLDVGGHPRDEHAGLVAVEERQRLALDVVEHADAQDPQEPLAGTVDEHVLLASAEVGDDATTT